MAIVKLAAIILSIIFLVAFGSCVLMTILSIGGAY
ncbi:hypothetical protein ES708_02596 [subsurface metagenome]